jgi:hypothetical protein
MGPYGSAKSVACVHDLFFNLCKQRTQKDGKKRARYAVVRGTYRELEDSTINTFKDWMGPFGELKVTSHIFELRWGNMEADFYFRALDKPEDVKKLLSTEYTKAWLNEGREVPEAVFKALKGRVGRYPPANEGGCVQPGIIIDTNPPDEDEWSWIYNKFEIEMYKDPQVAEEYAWYKQPPGAVQVDGRWEDNWGQGDGPRAENIENLPQGYYRKMCVGEDREWIKVYAEGKYGFVQSGKPVFSQYNDEMHCREFEADPSLPLMMGWDAGLTPACVIGQLSRRGQLRILEDLNAKNMGVFQFARDIVSPLLATKYGDFKCHDVTWADPANTRGDAAEQSAIGILNDSYIFESDQSDGVVQMPLKLPFMTIPSPGGNTLAPRLEAVNQYLTRLIDGAPAFLLHPRCAMLRKGFMGKYHFERVQVSGSDERFKELPKKNAYSHGADALQNLCKGTLGETDAQDDDFEYDDMLASTHSGWSGR